MSIPLMGDEKILNYKDSILRNSDLDILSGSCYLNDEIIGFYFHYLASEFDREEILLVPPSIAFWLTNIESAEIAKENVDPMNLCDKNIIVFPVNNCYDGDDGTHWSTMVYYRGMNLFVHHDSMQGVNNECATKLYEVVKGFVSSPNSSKSLSKVKTKNKKKKDRQHVNKSSLGVMDSPGFTEYEMTPQQSNGYDCGLYVLAVTRIICEWYACGSRGKDADWFSVMKKRVDVSTVEMNMRSEVLKIIEDLRV